MPDMLAPCGIDCAACDIYQAANDPAKAVALAEQWKSWQPDAQPDWFKCQGCRADRGLCWSEDCRIYACCAERNLHDCGQCADFPCADYQAWIGPYPHHQAAYARLQEMQK
jgi:hypothetical protein